MLISLMYMNLRSPWLPTVVHILYLQINGGRCLTTFKAHPSLLYHILGGGAGTKMQLLHSVDRAGLGSAVTEAGKSRKCWSHLNMPQSQIHFLPVNWGWTHQTLVTMFRWSCRDTRNRIYLDVSLRSSVPRTKERRTKAARTAHRCSDGRFCLRIRSRVIWRGIGQGARQISSTRRTQKVLGKFRISITETERVRGGTDEEM